MIFNQYPYLNLNDLNLDYILAQIKTMMNEVTNFVSINAIKYADPIQWDITRQYEKNTVVIDPVTGTAYISVAPVPAGVALTRPEYWTVVFDLGSFVTKAAKNFTSRYEESTTLTATFPSNTGDWLVWGDILYKALTNITAGDAYVENSNIEHFTIEDVYISYLNTIANILALVGDLADLTTSDTTSIVNAINSVVSDIGNVASDLAQEVIDRTNADNALNTMKANKSDVIVVVNALENGCVADGTTDNSAIITSIISDLSVGDVLYFPRGDYYMSTMVDVTKQITIMGDGGLAYDPATRFLVDAGAFTLSASGITLRDFKVIANAHAWSGIQIFNSWCTLDCVGVDDAAYDTTKFFENCIEVGDASHNSDFAILSHVEVNARHRGSGAPTLTEMNGYGMKFIGGTNIVVSNCNIMYKNIGVLLPATQYNGHYIDGITFDNMNIVWSNYAFNCYNASAIFADNLICDQIVYGIYLNACKECRFVNSHYGYNSGIGGNPSAFLELYGCDLITFNNAYIYATGVTDYGLKVAASTNVAIYDAYIKDAPTGISVQGVCTCYGENVTCNGVTTGVNTAYSGTKTFIKNVTGATTNYAGTTFGDRHAETIKGNIGDLGNTTNYYGITIPTNYGKIPDNVIFTITNNSVPTRAFCHQYTLASATTTNITILLYTADGANFNNESIEYAVTCIYE